MDKMTERPTPPPGSTGAMGNTSHAVRAQRTEPMDSLDDFPTPPWATRAICEYIGPDRLRGLACREPAANRGHMSRVLGEYFDGVEASDVHDYGAGFPVSDYLAGDLPEMTDWTITNPPFRLAAQFIHRALLTSREGVAMLVRLSFVETVGRYYRLFEHDAPAVIYPFTERVVMHKGKLAPKGSTATAYCWLVWNMSIHPAPVTLLEWIAPCRRRLERAGDYEGGDTP